MAIDERRVTIGFRENSRNPGHARISVFVGRNEGSRGHAGEIVMRTDEWDELRERIDFGGLDSYVDVIKRAEAPYGVSEHVARERELEMMTNSDLWPIPNTLPLKRREGPEPRHGRLIVNQGPTVYLHNDVDLEYQSFEEILDDGWVVD